MKKAIVLSLVFVLLMSSIAAAGIFDSLTGKATDPVLNSPGFFAKLIQWVSASEGDKYSLSAGQSVYMCGHKVGLEFVGDGGAQTIVDGDSKYVNKGASLVISGVKVKVKDVNAPEQTASLALLCINAAVETEEEEPVSAEVDEDSLRLEKCSVSSARFCYLGASADFDEEDVFACMRTQACAGIEEELNAGGAENALSQISEKDIACYKKCLVDLKCYIEELDVCWHPEHYATTGESVSLPEFRVIEYSCFDGTKGTDGSGETSNCTPLVKLITAARKACKGKCSPQSPNDCGVATMSFSYPYGCRH